MIYTYTGILLSHKKTAISNYMGGPRDYHNLSEVTKRKINTICYHLYVKPKI